MTTINVAHCASFLALGKQGENLARAFAFDISKWVTEFGDGIAVLLHQRKGDTTPYPCATTLTDDGVLTWPVTSADNAVTGKGKAELQYIVDDKVVKSHTYTTISAVALEAAGEAPDPETGWVAKLLAEVQAMCDKVSGISANDLAAAVAAYLEGNPITVETTDAVEQDNTLPVTSGGVYTVVGNIEALLSVL